MFDWVNRDVLLDISINVIPVVILAYFVALTLLRSPWDGPLLETVLTHTLTVFPILVLLAATYYVARAIERDAQQAGPGRP